MNTPSSTPGICRIDQPEKYNHGFFVRLQRNGKIYSAFFSNKNHVDRPSRPDGRRIPESIMNSGMQPELNAVLRFKNWGVVSNLGGVFPGNFAGQ